MQGIAKTKLETYRNFLEFISKEIQLERSKVNRRMLSVLVWSFVLPAIASITLLVLIKVGALPRTSRNYLEWVILIFPVAYSLFLLSSEVLMQLPATLRRGGIATILKQSADDAQWREKTTDEMIKAVSTDAKGWAWICHNFKFDLDRILWRARYLTALAGAVFYLVLQGIDLIGEDTSPITWIKSPAGWVELSQNNFPQFIALGLFLILFYLSGSQSYHTLLRFLNCAELIEKEKTAETLVT